MTHLLEGAACQAALVEIGAVGRPKVRDQKRAVAVVLQHCVRPAAAAPAVGQLAAKAQRERAAKGRRGNIVGPQVFGLMMRNQHSCYSLGKERLGLQKKTGTRAVAHPPTRETATILPHPHKMGNRSQTKTEDQAWHTSQFLRTMAVKMNGLADTGGGVHFT